MTPNPSQEMSAAEIVEDALEERGGGTVIYSGQGMSGRKIHDSRGTYGDDKQHAPSNPVLHVAPQEVEKLPCLGGCGKDIVRAPGQLVYAHAGECKKRFKRDRKRFGL